MSSASPSPEASTSSLHPVKLSRVPAHWSESSALRHQLVALKDDIAEYEKLETKLATITDEPVWDAMIPFGPLAYFPGQLVHTNDITLTRPSPLPPTNPSSSVAAAPPPAPPASDIAVLKSAKQARATAADDRDALERLVARVEEELHRADELAKQRGGDGLEEGWVLNEKGEVINEEGLPMFDIHEDLPPEEEEVELPKVAPPPKPKSTALQMRYLIKKGGKQIVRPLNPPLPTPTTLAPPIPTPSPPSPVPTSTPEPPPKDTSVTLRTDEPLPSRNLDAHAILDQLEREEEEEARALAAANEIEVKKQIAEVVGVDEGPSPSKEVKATPASTPSVKGKETARPPARTPPSKEFLSSFGSGFLNRGKGIAKPAAAKKSSPLPAPSSPSSSPPPSSPPTSPNGSESSTHHQPRHRTLPPPESIYRPTPPSSAPNSRPNSPFKNLKVAFDSAALAPKAPKHKRATILLPAPPPHSDAEPEEAETPPPPPPKPKEPFVRPIKENIVERPIRPPTAPKVRASLMPQATKPPKDGAESMLKTIARPPRATAVPGAIVERETATPQPFAVPTNSPSPLSGPAHTLSLGGKGPVGPGVVSAREGGVLDEEDYEEPDPSDDGPSLTSDEDDDSDSSGFYGNEDEEDEAELDIDSALHAREVALEYHRQRMNLGAGAGTGPLGGDADPGVFDSWNQENVPLEATLQGRTPNSGRSSRFRTGRLESAQMIIPTLLAQQVRTDDPSRPDASDEEDDGLSPEERANIARSLEALSGAQNVGGPSSMVGQRVTPQAPVASISQMLGGSAGSQGDSAGRQGGKAPPTVVRATPPAGVPISVPVNRSLAGVVEAPAPALAAVESPADAGGPAKPEKKMSRFKARQLGLE